MTVRELNQYCTDSIIKGHGDDEVLLMDANEDKPILAEVVAVKLSDNALIIVGSEKQ